MSLFATLNITSCVRHNRTRIRNAYRRVRDVHQSRVLNLVYESVHSDSEEDDACDAIDVGSPTETTGNTNTSRKIGQEAVTMSLRGTTDDVDELVEMINLNNLQHGHAANPKKAAKKARQKARREEERQRAEDKAEAEQALLEAEEQKRLAEEQLERTVRQLRSLNISRKANGECFSMKENKNCQDQREHIHRKEAANQKIGKGSSAAFAENKGKGLSVSNQCNNLCPKHSILAEAYEPVPNPTASSGGKKKKKKKSQGQEQFQTPPVQSSQVGYCSHTCSSHPCSVPPPTRLQPIILDDEPEEDPNSAKSKKARKKARQQLRRAESNHSANAASSSSTSSSQSPNLQSCNYGHPVVINVPNPPPFGLAASKIQIPNISNLKGGNSHLDWNQLSEETSAPTTTSKPEMVTIRRHPTVSDTTVTISIKNQNGEEDVLYTLLNGQVVRSKPDAVDIDSFITDSPREKDGSKKSKKKRNRKKTNKKEAVEGIVETKSQNQRDREQVHLERSKDRDIVTCTPVMQSPSPASSTPDLILNGPQIPDVKPLFSQRSSYSLFNELDEGAEIDLSKLKLPPGITITKVNQPMPTFGGLEKVEKHSKDNVEMSYSDPPSSTAPSTPGNESPSQAAPSLYYSDGFHSKPNVIVVDSQECNADNESDADDFVGFKKRPNKFEEVVSVKAKRLRNRVNRYLYGDDPSDRQENIPEKILTPAQASMYMNQHMQNRVKATDVNDETRPNQTASSSARSTPEPVISSFATVPRSNSTGPKRKQPNVPSMSRFSRPKEYQQSVSSQPVSFVPGFNPSDNFLGYQKLPDNSNPFSSFGTYPTQSFNFQTAASASSSPLHGPRSNLFHQQSTQLNGFGNWTPPTGFEAGSNSSIGLGAHSDYIHNNPFLFDSNDSH